jgi:hypothetical protein
MSRYWASTLSPAMMRRRRGGWLVPFNGSSARRK